jgi:hypothetical protein
MQLEITSLGARRWTYVLSWLNRVVVCRETECVLYLFSFLFSPFPPNSEDCRWWEASVFVGKLT